MKNTVACVDAAAVFFMLVILLLPDILMRSQTGCFFELSAEIRGVAVTEKAGNFAHCVISGQKVLLRSGYFDKGAVCAQCFAVCGPKTALQGKSIAADPCR